MHTEPQPDGSRRMLWRQLRKNTVALWGLAVILTFFLVAVAADFIANDKPLVMRYHGELYFPVLKDYAVWAGISRWRPEFQNVRFREFFRANFKPADWALFPPIPYSPDQVNLDEHDRPPSYAHFFGTDDVGRDTASRIVHGARVSLSVGVIAVSIYMFIGVAIGALAGFYGGAADIIASRMIEIMLTIPTFFLIITIVAFLPPSLFYIMLVIGLTNWPRAARLARGEFLKARSQEYVVAARALGAADARLIFRHILPNTLAPVLVTATFGVGSAILVESTLSFLGLGVPSTTASWGSMLYNGRQLLPNAWWLTAFPGLAVFLTVLSYNVVGEGIRDAADPRLKT